MKVMNVVCDLCGGDEDVVEDMDWEWDSQTGQVDVCASCRARVLSSMQPVTGLPVSELVEEKPKKKAAPKQGKPKSDLATIRAWAKENGVEVPTRGRIPAEVRIAYQRSQTKSKSAFA